MTGRILTFEAGGVPLAFDLADVRSVSAWQEPLALPKGRPWLEGIVEGEAQVVPVLRRDYFDRDAPPPDTYVVVEYAGRPLAVPGSGASVEGLLQGGEPTEQGEGPFRAVRSPSGLRRLVEPRILYSLLGIRYTSTDRIGGRNAEENLAGGR